MVTEENQVSTHTTLDARESTECQQEQFKQETHTNEQTGNVGLGCVSICTSLASDSLDDGSEIFYDIKFLHVFYPL